MLTGTVEVVTSEVYRWLLSIVGSIRIVSRNDSSVRPLIRRETPKMGKQSLTFWAALLFLRARCAGAGAVGENRIPANLRAHAVADVQQSDTPRSGSKQLDQARAKFKLQLRSNVIKGGRNRPRNLGERIRDRGGGNRWQPPHLDMSPLELDQYDISENKYPSHLKSIAYVAPDRTHAVGFSTCAKCGSTSLMKAVFEGIYGVSWNKYHNCSEHDPCGPPWVHSWVAWPKKGRAKNALVLPANLLNTADCRMTKQMFQVVRDPMERYISAFRSKFMCCNPKSMPNSTTVRKSCVKNNDMVVKSYIKEVAGSYVPFYNKTQDEPCLFLNEFVTVLSMIVPDAQAHPNSKSTLAINDHIRPQTVKRLPGCWVSWVGTIQEFAVGINGLRIDGLDTINVVKNHGSGIRGAYTELVRMGMTPAAWEKAQYEDKVRTAQDIQRLLSAALSANGDTDTDTNVSDGVAVVEASSTKRTKIATLTAQLLEATEALRTTRQEQAERLDETAAAAAVPLAMAAQPRPNRKSRFGMYGASGGTWWETTETSLAKLCEIVKPEYNALGIDFAQGPCGKV